jgi:hypothetical protein
MMETAEQSVNAHPQELRKPHCCAAARVDFNQGIYVFRCSANTPACTAIAASTSAGVVKLYTLSSGAQLTHITDLRGHGGGLASSNNFFVCSRLYIPQGPACRHHQ